MITVKSKGRRGLSSAALFKVAQDGLLPRFHKSVEVVPLQHIPMAQLGVRDTAQLAKPLHKLVRAAHILCRLLQSKPPVRHNPRFGWFLIAVSIHLSQPSEPALFKPQRLSAIRATLFARWFTTSSSVKRPARCSVETLAVIVIAKSSHLHGCPVVCWNMQGSHPLKLRECSFRGWPQSHSVLSGLKQVGTAFSRINGAPTLFQSLPNVNRRLTHSLWRFTALMGNSTRRCLPPALAFFLESESANYE
jgi:hypothetical protein